MQKVMISDVTLRESEKTISLSFKEKIDIAKKLDRLNVDVIETPVIKNTKTDILFLHTISPLIKNSIISCPVDYSVEAIEKTADAFSAAEKKRLHLMVPTSTVQMEYVCKKKPEAVLEMIETLIKKCVSLCEDVEFSALDASRSEKEFLYEAIRRAIAGGAKTITVCDSAGEMLPDEYSSFIRELYENVPELSGVTLSAECSDEMDMATACMISSMNAGVRQIKASVSGGNYPSLTSAARIMQVRGDSIGVTSSINYTALEHTVDRMSFMRSANAPVGAAGSDDEKIVLSDKDDIKTVSAVIVKMGYDLSEEDIANVYEEFIKVAKKKQVGTKELDAIIASSALQVKPTYKLKSYVINSGNIITASAVMVLEKDGEELQGMTVGDGPIDAAFQCIEQIAGRHFELDDFQIQSVTEGREAVGAAVVKLRSDGRLYSGKGISTDIVESSINAYINALNKICFEEV
ncbi:MAG: hypothetical protein J6C82_06385 [Clostridia bacterium]|nr:hypothetical protein [Clostridia bacterium]MBP3359881.1 hypothetical protein [Clostridia bacterium]